jgi:hypothetical protein
MLPGKATKPQDYFLRVNDQNKNVNKITPSFFFKKSKNDYGYFIY